MIVNIMELDIAGDEGSSIFDESNWYDVFCLNLVFQDHRLEDDDSRNNNLVDPVAYKVAAIKSYILT